MSLSNTPTTFANEARRDLWGPVLCGAAMATVGTSVVASKVIGIQVEPFAATALRHLLAFPMLALLCWLLRPAWPRPSRRDALILLLQAASGSVGYTVLLIAGTSMASAADPGVVAGTLPAMAALFAILILGERPGLLALLGIALTTAGVLLLSMGGGSEQGVPLPQRSLGIALVAAAVACEVVFILGQRRLLTPIEPLTMATLMSFGGLVAVAASRRHRLGDGLVAGCRGYQKHVGGAGHHRLVRMGAHRHWILALVCRCAPRHGHASRSVHRVATSGRGHWCRSGAGRKFDSLTGDSAGVGAGGRARRLHHPAQA